MSEETRDEFAAWRGLLQPADALPGRGLADKEAAWDRLFDRLNERPRRLFFSYRVAAACVLILLIPASRFFQHQSSLGPHRPLAQPVATHTQPAAPHAQPAAPLAITPAGTPAVRTAPATPLPLVPLAKARPSSARTTQQMAQQTTQRSVLKPLPIQPATTENTPRDTVIAVLTTTPPAPLLQSQKPKKQWKVVDLNELDPGHQRPHNIAASRNARPPGLTINLSSENR